MSGYLEAITSRRYWIKLGPLGGILILALIRPLTEGYGWYLAGAAVAWLFVVAFWWNFNFLNDQLEKRDAEHLKTSPRAREDRAYRLLSELLRDGQKALTGWTPEQIERWDERVRLTLATWCSDTALSVYTENSRPHGEHRLTEPHKALDQLDKIVNSHLSVYLR